MYQILGKDFFLSHAFIPFNPLSPVYNRFHLALSLTAQVFLTFYLFVVVVFFTFFTFLLICALLYAYI